MLAPAWTSPDNRLLGDLPEADRRAVVALARRVDLHADEDVFEPGEVPDFVVFPTSGICSHVMLLKSGRTVHAGTVGNEGMLGLAVYLGVDFEAHAHVVKVAGDGLRMPSDAFLEMTRRSPAFEATVRRYVAYTIRAANQAVACNALHSVMERTCRWILATHDRIGDDDLPMKHEFLAEMAATHRQTVTAITGDLQRAGVIRHQRGRLRVVDRRGLEERACECYVAVRRMYERVRGEA